jgi:hypothetical protein
MHSIGRLFFYSVLLVIVGCGLSDHIGWSSKNEMVMSEGMIIVASFPSGSLKIEADKRMKRIFQWENEKVFVDLIARHKRWHGSLGAYSPGGSDSIHFVIDEGQQHFCSILEASEWLILQEDRMDYVYTSDGLVIRWEAQSQGSSPKKIFRAQIWQLYINGEKPSNLAGSTDEKIDVYFKNNYTKKYPGAGEFIPSKPKTINSYLYSGKVLDLMEEEKRTPDDIEKVIRYGDVERSGGYVTYYASGDKFDSFNDLFWVKTDNKKRIILFD